MGADEASLAAVVADVAVNNLHRQIITWTLLLIW